MAKGFALIKIRGKGIFSLGNEDTHNERRRGYHKERFDHACV